MSRVPIAFHYIALVVVPAAVGLAVVHLWGWPLWAGAAIAVVILIGGVALVVGVVVAVAMLIFTQVQSMVDEANHPSGVWNHANIEGVTDWESGDRS